MSDVLLPSGVTLVATSTKYVRGRVGIDLFLQANKPKF